MPVPSGGSNFFLEDGLDAYQISTPNGSGLMKYKSEYEKNSCSLVMLFQFYKWQ